MDENNKRKSESVLEQKSKIRVAEADYGQITYDTSNINLHQQLYLNNVPVMQNQQLLYQLENTDGSQQNVIYVVVPENVVPNSTVIPTINKEEQCLSNEKNVNVYPKITQNCLEYTTPLACQDKTSNIKPEAVYLKNGESEQATKSWRSHLYVCDCKPCSMTFNSIYEKKAHMETHYFPESREFKCNLCNMVFEKAIDRNKHIETHTIPCNYKCKNCNKAFPYYTSLTKHIEQKDCGCTSKLLSCSLCGSKFVDCKDFNEHHNTNLRVCKCSAKLCGDHAFQVHTNFCSYYKNNTTKKRTKKGEKKDILE